MNKTVIAIVCLCVFFIALWITVRVTNVLTLYHISSYTNAPTLKPGQMVTGSRWRHPDTNTFVCIKGKFDIGVYIYRCVAKGNDLVEIRDGVLYLNGKRRNEPYTWNQYHISTSQLHGIERFVHTYHYPVYDLNDSTHAITMSAADVKNYHLDLKPWIISRHYIDSGMFSLFVKLGYNRDHFGPIRVPKNSYFLLGDNRHNAYDSRYLGFIPVDRVVCTVIHQ